MKRDETNAEIENEFDTFNSSMAVVDCENARVLISPQANNMRLFVVALLANFYRTRV